MESALMTVPPRRSASSTAAADLPLAVGPAIRMALGRLPCAGRWVTSRPPFVARVSAGWHGDESELALAVRQQEQHRAPAGFSHRRQSRLHVLRLPNLLLGDLDNDVAGLYVLLRRRTVRLDIDHDDAFDRGADAVTLAQVVGERGEREPEQILALRFRFGQDFLLALRRHRTLLV